MSIFSKYFSNSEPSQQKDVRPKIQVEEIGSSGTEIYSGLYNEEYLSKLSNYDAADIYDKMRRSDTQVALALSSVVNTICSGKWAINAFSSVEIEDEKLNAEFGTHRKFINHIIFEGLDKPWPNKLKEFLTCVPFGHCVIERVHKIVKSSSNWGDYIGIKKLAWRSPKTIYQWVFDKETKDFLGVTQILNGDLAKQSHVFIPAQDLIIFNIDCEGDNLEGIAMLRQCYGPWMRKELYLKLMAIGTEKTAIPTPKGKYPLNEYGSTEYTNFKNALLALTSHNRNYIMLPQRQDGVGYDVEILKIDFDAEKIKSSIDYEDMSMVRRFVAQFLMLGSQASGSWALSTDQSDFFLNGIVYVADMICFGVNNLIKELIDINFGPQVGYPVLAHSGIRDKAGKELAEIIAIGKGAGVVVPDDSLEAFYRKQYDMPVKDIGYSREEIEARENEKAQAAFDRQKEIAKNSVSPQGSNEPDNDKKFGETITLSEADKGVTKRMKQANEKIINIYKAELKTIGEDLVNQVIHNIETATTDLQKVGAARNIQPRNVSKFRKSLLGVLQEISETEISEVYKLFQDNKALAEKGAKGKKKAARYITAQADAIVETQVGDLKNAVVLQYSSSVNEDSAKRIKQDLDERIEKKLGVIEAGAGTVTSGVINKSREFLFTDEELIQEIESYTFMNPDPKSDICSSLVGKTFLTTDADSWRYAPPLHYNCKSFLSPNFRVAKKNPKATGLVPFIGEKEIKSMNLSEL